MNKQQIAIALCLTLSPLTTQAAPTAPSLHQQKPSKTLNYYPANPNPYLKPARKNA
ncbi:MAG: hypothetical protein ABFS56_26400 [Pseudomonadota bacterium]